MEKRCCLSALELFHCLPPLFLPLWKTARLHGKKLQNATNENSNVTAHIKGLTPLCPLVMFSRYGKRQKTILALCHQMSVDTFVWRWEEVRTNIHSTFISILKKKTYIIDKYWLQNIRLWAFLMLVSATQHETHRRPYLQTSSFTIIKFQWNLRFDILDPFFF